jgi:hypothetical protein
VDDIKATNKESNSRDTRLQQKKNSSEAKNTSMNPDQLDSSFVEHVTKTVPDSRFPEENPKRIAMTP